MALNPPTDVAGLLDVEVHSEEDQWPEKHGKHS
jgi:hypothetical protein